MRLGVANALPSSYQPPQSWRTSLDEAVYPSAYIGRQTERWLRNFKASGETRPFFLQCSFPDPHHPFTPPGKYWDMYDPDDIVLPANFGKGDSPMLRHLREAFESGTANRNTTLPYVVTEKEARETTALNYGAISMVDDQVGIVLRALKDEGLAENTILVFMADHGEYMGDYGIMLKGPIHSQSMIRIPFIWTDPQMPGLSSTSALTSTLDLSATVLSRAGLLPYHGLQGRSMLSLIQEEQEANGFARRCRAFMLSDWSARVSSLGASSRVMRVSPTCCRRCRRSFFRQRSTSSRRTAGDAHDSRVRNTAGAGAGAERSQEYFERRYFFRATARRSTSSNTVSLSTAWWAVEHALIVAFVGADLEPLLFLPG